MEFIRTNTALIGAVVAALTIGGMVLVSLTLAKTKWLAQERRFIYSIATSSTKREETATAFFRKITLIASVASLISHIALWGIIGAAGINGLIIAAVTIFIWVAVFSSIIDIRTKRIPMELFKYAYLGGAALGILAAYALIERETLGSLLVRGLSWFSIWLIMFIPAVFNAGGMSDARIILTAALLLWWWIPVSYAGYAMIIAAAAGLIYFLVVKIVTPKDPELHGKVAKAKERKTLMRYIASKGMFKPPAIKIIEKKLDEGKASEANIQEWLSYTKSTANSGTLPFAPYLSFGFLSTSIYFIIVNLL